MDAIRLSESHSNRVPNCGGYPDRLGKAAREFEGLLLSSMLAPLERSFSAVPGSDGEAGAQDYGFLGVQALADAVANAGGIGIGNLLVGQLRGTEVSGRSKK